jgi:hypothetical protein
MSPGFGYRCLVEPPRPLSRLMVMTAPRRLAMTLTMMAVPVALAAGCASATSAHPAAAVKAPAAAAVKAPAAATARFSAMGLAFRYPVSWRSGTWPTDQSNFSALIVYLSTSRLKGPCVVSISPGRIAETCEYPIATLPPGGVLVRWSANGFPTWHMPKANMTVAGRKAVETRTSGGWCATLRGTETITVMIPRAASGSWYQMDACLRRPGLAQQEAEISSMLKSVRISPGY